MAIHADLKKDIERLEADLADAAKRASNAASPAAAKDALAEIQGAVERALTEHGVSLDEIPQTREALLEAAKDMPRKHPLASLLVAVGVGVLLGRASK
ncbi:MAG: hypothetical protein NXH97_16350 [Rhodobacteraceae bacterium]|nr:hypothetical protein [Paracoccaceae bacterium]